MSSARRPIVLLALAACLAGVAASPARADGDPASDYLIGVDAFVPPDAGIPASSAEQLTLLLAQARKRGLPVKVALIASPYDLGSVAILWRHPQPYARFLGQELTYFYKHRLLIVMPNGYGLYDHGRPIAREQATLDRLASPGRDDLATAAVQAVGRLARLQHVELTVPEISSGAESDNHKRMLLMAGAAILAAAGAGLVMLHRRLKPRRR
jgi:hypothetical protein